MPICEWRSQMQDCFNSTTSPTRAKNIAITKSFIAVVDRILNGEWCFYFYHWFRIGIFPSWAWCPFTKKKWDNNEIHWSALQFFTKPGYDIKNIWELSRFYWAPQLALAYSFTGKKTYLLRLNQLVGNWCANNTPQKGFQWMCGQEVAIRLSNFLLANNLLYAAKDITSLSAIEFVETHVKRILLTMPYAIAQNNNHAISEAVALYFAGTWLLSKNKSSKLARKALLKGKRCLENGVQHLIAEDGTFAQYSVTYHRLVLDALSLCVWVQNKNKLPTFSKIFWKRYRSAFKWLFHIVDPFSGEAPNLGANDGAMFFKLDSCDYRDFRPTLQLASVLLDKKKIYSSGLWDTPLTALRIKHKHMLINTANYTAKEFYDGGLIKFYTSNHWLLLRYPSFRFRPSQSDIFHIDLWVKGKNILQDSGSYSYSLYDGEFKSTAAHNTIQLDEHNQMPLLSKFLWGSWIKIKNLNVLKTSGQDIDLIGEYTDYLSCKHTRKIHQNATGYVITDYVSGHKEKAVLRWHLCTGNWKLGTNGWRFGGVELLTCINNRIVFPKLKKSFRSLYYQKKVLHPMLELDINRPNAIVETFIKLYL
jgi:hypothetical protein